jgi:hypothetical protein
MTSPFTGTPLPNAIVYIPSSLVGEDEGLIADPTTGNISQNTEIIEYQAYLRPDTSKNYRIAEEGIDDSRFPVRGRLVNPMYFPVGFFAPITVKCQITLESGVLEGEVELEATIEPVLVAKIAGQKLQGIFRYTGDSNYDN